MCSPISRILRNRQAPNQLLSGHCYCCLVFKTRLDIFTFIVGFDDGACGDGALDGVGIVVGFGAVVGFGTAVGFGVSVGAGVAVGDGVMVGVNLSRVMINDWG